MFDVRVFCFLSVLLYPGLASSAPLDLETPVQEFLRTSGAPGVSVSVLEKGQLQPQSLSRGKACLDNDVEMRAAAVLKLGSVTKVFTGLRIKMLIEEGRLSLQTPISRFFPNFPRGNEIKVRHLLAHTSGVPEMLRLEPFITNASRAWQPQEVIDVVASYPLDFAPGTHQKYSNSGYLMLGRIIEIVTGESYEKQIVEKVAQPLGMGRLQAGDDTSIVKNEACGYASDAKGNPLKPMMVSMIPPMGTGNLIGRSEDIVRLVNQGRLLKHNLIDAPPSGPHILDNGEKAQVHVRFQNLAYMQSMVDGGLAVFRFDDGKMNLVGKDGMYPGFASWFLYDPESRTAIGVATNSEAKCMEAMQLAVRILQAARAQQRQNPAQ